MAQTEPKVLKVGKGFKVFRAFKVTKAIKVIKAFKASKVFKAFKVRQMGIKGLKVGRVPLEQMAQTEPKGFKACSRS